MTDIMAGLEGLRYLLRFKGCAIGWHSWRRFGNRCRRCDARRVWMFDPEHYKLGRWQRV